MKLYQLYLSQSQNILASCQELAEKRFIIQLLPVMLWVLTSAQPTWEICNGLITMSDRLMPEMVDDLVSYWSAQDPSHFRNCFQCGATQQLRLCKWLEAGKSLPCPQHGGLVCSCTFRQLRAAALYALCRRSTVSLSLCLSPFQPNNHGCVLLGQRPCLRYLFHG